MTTADFEQFCLEVYGYRPFPWQKRLVDQVCSTRQWPEQIAMPTSSGKTSLIDIAVFLLALESDRSPFDRIARLRTFFIIDRRVVVDEAGEHSKKLAWALETASAGIVSEVATRLRRFGG